MRERQRKGGNIEDPPTMLDHLSNGRNEPLANDIEMQLLHQMTLIAVGTVTTFSSTTQAIYDLASHPEYIPILRQEVESVPRDEHGNFNRDSTSAMEKLDSFLKESQRFNSPDLSMYSTKIWISFLTMPSYFPASGDRRHDLTGWHIRSQRHQARDQYLFNPRRQRLVREPK